MDRQTERRINKDKQNVPSSALADRLIIFLISAIPVVAEGNIMGQINDIEIKSATFTADMIPLPDNSATHVNATIRNLPEPVGKWVL